MIHHGLESQPKQGAKEGITILLSPEMAKTWIKNRSIISYRGDSIGRTTRLLSVGFKIKTVVTETKSKFKHQNTLLFVSYHPMSTYLDNDANDFIHQITNMISLLPKSNILIIGADLNASISMRSSNSSSNNDENHPSVYLLGPHGI